jgi:hypothetical protein
MAGATKKSQPLARRGALDSTSEQWIYPTGMVWCPMKMSGMALMRCAQLQKQFGCGNLRQFQILTSTRADSVPFHWPWLRRGRECPGRADEAELRELRLALTPLKLVEKSRKNPRAYQCPDCGGQKAFGARRCRRCWRLSQRA